MNFLDLEEMHKKWQDILVIGKTVERDHKRYHIVGMTQEPEAKLYIIEPYDASEQEEPKRRGIRNHRRMLKESRESGFSYLHCREIYLGEQRLEIQGGSSTGFQYLLESYGEIQLFFDMMQAGWTIPEWLKDEEWSCLQLVTLNVAELKGLPSYTPGMPIIIKHGETRRQQILEKTITLQVGKSRSFQFTDQKGDQVQCYINRVELVDVRKQAEEQFDDPIYQQKLEPEQFEEMKHYFYNALQESCPKGMCWVQVEYECTKNLSLQFYSKEYLRSHPSRTSALLILPKPERKIGTHQLPLRGCMIQTAVSPDTSKIPAEAFFAFETVDAWEETIV